MTRSDAYGGWMKKLAKVLLIACGIIAFLVFLGWLGLRFQPAKFPDYDEVARQTEPVPLPKGLPAPVERFYEKTYGDKIPVIKTVVITGRARMRPMGPWMPARYRFTHDAGKGYRHYFEATWFGLPFFKINERYLDGKGVMELPFGTERSPNIDQAANLTMWAELAVDAPAALLTDKRVKWKAVDNRTAKLIVPFGENDTDSFIVRFDPATDDLISLEAMRYKASTDAKKTLWTAKNEAGPKVGIYDMPATGSATWADASGPWAYFTAETIDYNVDVAEYIRKKGI